MKSLPVFLLTLASLAFSAFGADKKPMPANPSSTDTQGGASAKTERLTFGGGCFWCIEAVFQRLPGVKKVVSGYAGGTKENPTYEEVCEGTTGHAEVVQLEYDPTKISFEQLMEVFWAAHDPTTVLKEDTFKHGKLYPKGTAYQGADIGSQYRSAIFYENEAQKIAAEKSKAEEQKNHKDPIATEIAPLKKFYPAEDYHQNYFNQNGNTNGYCRAVIRPKLQKLLQKGLIQEEPQK